MAKFEKVSNCAGARLPVRKTQGAAGYDFFVSKDTVIFPYSDHVENLAKAYVLNNINLDDDNFDEEIIKPKTLDEVASLTKKFDIKPTLVPTGIKAKLDDGTYLELSVRSSCPLKYWLILANGVGIIDADYYNNPDNEGEIFFQIINLSPIPIILKEGDCIGQGIIKRYETTEDDSASGTRIGGFGSTGA